MTHCPEHGTTLPCNGCAGMHAAGEHPNRDHGDTCARCATPPAQIDAVSLAAADDTLTETEETP